MRKWPLRESRLLHLHGGGFSFSSDELRELTTEPPTDFVEAWFTKTSGDPRARLIQRRDSDQTGGQIPQRLDEYRGEINRGSIERGTDCIAISTCGSVSRLSCAVDPAYLVASWTCPNSAS